MYVCYCAQVRESEVLRSIENGARTITAVGDACRAGTQCGGCHHSIAELLEHVHGESVFPEHRVLLPLSAA